MRKHFLNKQAEAFAAKSSEQDRAMSDASGPRTRPIGGEARPDSPVLAEGSTRRGLENHDMNMTPTVVAGNPASGDQDPGLAKHTSAK